MGEAPPLPGGDRGRPQGRGLPGGQDWQDKENSIWTDGPISEDEGLGGGGGVAAGGEGGAAVDMPRPASGRRHTLGPKEAGWAGRPFHHGKNKEVFDERNKEGQDYTVRSDSTAAIERKALTGRYYQFVPGRAATDD